MAARVDIELCTGCGICAEVCPANAISIQDRKARVDVEACVECGLCIGEGPREAIWIKKDRFNWDEDPMENVG